MLKSIKDKMNWDDKGYLISKSKYNENSLIAEFFTQDHGKTSGIIFGGTSKKIKNYLQIGNKIHLSYNSKSENKIGYFKIEIEQALSPFYFDNSKKLSCIKSAMNLIKLLSAESQRNQKIYNLIDNFYIILNDKNWLKKYIFWELSLLKNFGYDLDFDNFVQKKIINNELKYISKSSSQKIIPNFLIEKNDDIEKLPILLDGLKLVGDYLEKTILKPNNITVPLSRIHFLNLLK